MTDTEVVNNFFLDIQVNFLSSVVSPDMSHMSFQHERKLNSSTHNSFQSEISLIPRLVVVKTTSKMLTCAQEINNSTDIA